MATLTTIIGHVTKDAVVFANANGTSTIKYTVAENYRDAKGNEGVAYYPVTQIVKGDSKLASYLLKGKYISVSARPTMSKTYTDKNGVTRYPEVQLMVTNVTFLQQAKKTAAAAPAAVVPAEVELPL